jgi:hypothetical protein
MHSPRRGFAAVVVALGLLAAVQTPVAPVAADASVVASASNGSASARTTITVNRPAGTQAGHVMVASIVSNDDEPGFTAPAGWTVLRQHTIKDTLRQAVYVKVAGTAEPASYAWKVSSSRRLAGGITSFAGVDTAQPVDAVNGAVNPSSTAVPAPVITTTVPNTLLVHLAAVSAEATVAPPTGMTERWEATAANTSKKDVVASLSESVQTLSGATGPRVATASRAGKSIGVLLALRPAGPAGPDTVPPETVVVSGPSGTTTNVFAPFTFSATEPASFRCQLDAGLPETCTSPKTYVNLNEGAHTFAVVATDVAGNVDPTPATRSWTVAPGGSDPVVVGAGDIGHCGTDNDEATAQLLDHIPGRVFVLGDNTYAKAGDGASVELADFVECYGPTWGRHKDRTVPVVGNHEYVGPDADGYFSYFGAAAGDPTKGYYDYREGAWHVIVLNSNCVDVGGCGPGSPQEQWLRGVLAASDADCTVAMWHNPLYSSGATHGSDPTFRPFWQALYDHGADVVLNGHDHVYERFGLQTPDGAADAVFGLRQFTVGTGGRSSYGFATPLPNSDVRGRSYGVLKMTLHDGSYDWEFVPAAGQTLTDSGTTACHGAPDPAPPPPPPPPPPLADAIAVVGSTSDGLGSGRASITIGRPAGSAAGHVLVAAIGANDDTVISAPSGWTAVRQDVSGAVRQSVYVKVAGPTEPTAYTWTLSGTRRVAGGITAYSGVDPSQPIDAVNGSSNPSSTAAPAPSITTTTDRTMLVHLATVNAEGTMTAPAGWTEAWEATSPNLTSTRDVLVSSSQASRPLAGPTGSAVATASLPGSSVGVILALRPAP